MRVPINRSSVVDYFRLFIIVISATGPGQGNAALPSGSVTLQRPISFNQYPVIITAREFPFPEGIASDRMGLLAVHADRLRPIVFQIDAKDEKGRFILNAKDDEYAAAFDANDELVFMSGDAGTKLQTPYAAMDSPLIEIELVDPVSGVQRWVYVIIHDRPNAAQPSQKRVHYNRKQDAIYSDIYRIRFVKETPFLVGAFNWSDAGGDWSPDLIDRMKVRHTGELFGVFPFERTHGDYTSELIAVKDGPVRVIRRTSNRVRILWYLKTPQVLIDYVAYSNVVFMDTHIDLPFRLGGVLKDIRTFTTVDWDDNPDLPESYVHTESLTEGIAIDGVSDSDETRLNRSGDKWLVINNDYGSVLTGLVPDRRLPITRRVYIRDDRLEPDPPEDVPGQFGNVGFVSDGWDKVGSGLQHMLFAFYMVREIAPADGVSILQHGPWHAGE